MTKTILEDTFTQTPSATRNAEGNGSIASDIVNNRFKIISDRPLSHFNTDFGVAYDVQDLKNKVYPDATFAFVFNKHLPTRIQVMQKLKEKSIAHFQNVLVVETVYFSHSDETNLVAIIEKPRGITLTDYIQQKGIVSEFFIQDYLVPPICKVLHELGQRNISHGYIHPDNIYLDDELNVMLGECICNLCGYKQPDSYEPIERAQSLPMGKGESLPASDFYSLGILIFFAVVGRTKPHSFSDKTFLRNKLSKGTFNTLIGDIDLSGPVMDLLRGLLYDRVHLRWGSQQLLDWTQGKRFNLIQATSLVEGSRTISFLGKQYYNRKALAHEMNLHWHYATEFIADDKLIKWVEGSIGDKDCADQLRHVKRTTSLTTKRGRFEPIDDLLARILMILDPDAPMRINNMAIHIDAIGPMLAHALATDNTEHIQTITHILHNDFILYKKPKIASQDDEKMDYVWIFSKCSTALTKRAYGFGIERCLYELNPMLPCQNPYTIKDYPLTLQSFLESLDKRTNEFTEYPIDRHMAAYITTKVELTNEIVLKGLSRFPRFASNLQLQMLALLALGQQTAQIKKLPNLTLFLSTYLLSIVDLFKSQSRRARLAEECQKVGKEGNLKSLFRLFSNPKTCYSDKKGYEIAHREYRFLEAQINQLQKKKNITALGYRYGLQLSIITAYVLCSFEIIVLILRSL